MSEDFRPELVTVTPLTRGTGNYAGRTVSSKGSGEGGEPLTYVINGILDGRVIDSKIEKVALKNIGLQI